MKRAIHRVALGVFAFALVTATTVPSNHTGVRVQLAVGAPAAAGLLDDPVRHIWDFLRDQVFGKIGGLLTGPIENAKQRILGKIDEARRRVDQVFHENVLAPAMEQALALIFPSGADGEKQIRDAVSRYLGGSAGMLERIEGYSEAALAIAERSPARLTAAIERFRVAHARLEGLNQDKLLDLLLPIAREKLEHFVRSITLRLVEAAWTIVQAPIDVAITAGKSAISAIPVIGQIAAPIVGAVARVALLALRAVALDFVTDGVTQLSMLAIDKLIDWLRKKQAGGERWLQGAFNAIRKTLSRANAILEPALKAYAAFGNTLFDLQAALKDPARLGTKTVRVYAGGITEVEIAASLGALRSAHNNVLAVVEADTQKARAAIQKRVAEGVVGPAFSAAASDVLGASKSFVDAVARRLSDPATFSAALDGAAQQAMQAVATRDGALLAGAEALLEAQRRKLTVTKGAILDELGARVEEPIVTHSLALLGQGADEHVKEVAAAVGASLRGTNDPTAKLFAGVAEGRIRAAEGELGAQIRRAMFAPEPLRALVAEMVRGAKGARDVSAGARAASQKLAAVASKVERRIAKRASDVARLLSVVRSLKPKLAAATKGGGR